MDNAIKELKSRITNEVNKGRGISDNKYQAIIERVAKRFKVNLVDVWVEAERISAEYFNWEFDEADTRKFLEYILN